MLYNVWNTNQTATMQTQVLTKKQPPPQKKKTTHNLQRPKNKEWHGSVMSETCCRIVNLQLVVKKSNDLKVQYFFSNIKQ